MVHKEGKNKLYVESAVVTLIVIVLLILSGPLVDAVMVTLQMTTPSNVEAGPNTSNRVNFSVTVNITDPDAYVPMSQMYLNLTGPLEKTFIMDLDGNVLSGYSYPDELNVTVSPDSDTFNYSYGSGYGYSSDYGFSDFGYGYGYGYGYETGYGTLSRTYNLSLNTSMMYDGNYTAQFTVFTDRLPGGTEGMFPAFQSETADFTITPRVFQASIPEILNGTATDEEIIQTPAGNISYIIVTDPNNSTIPVTFNITVQVQPPASVPAVNSTDELGAGAMPDIYFSISVDNPAWYDNISYVHVRIYYNESDIPASVVESTLRPARYLTNASNTGWERLSCPTCPRLLEVDPIDGRDVILKAADVDTTNNYVWANLTHYSTFSIGGTITASSSSSSGSSSGGTGGGGGGTSSNENGANIELNEKYDMQISKDATTSYKFTNKKNPIMFVNITGATNLGIITTSVEVLKDTSTIAKTPAGGLIYKNINIWVGTTGFATPKNIKEALIKFRVDNAWMSANSVEGSDIVLVKWDGSTWKQLETKVLSKDDASTYFEGKTDSFSPFAITAKAAAESAITAPVSTEAPTPAVTGTAVPPTPSQGISPWIIVLIIVVIIGAGVYIFVVKKQDK
ncbi:MAG TPA: PGF-pre-PGF domain-containing protein [Candidatus Methylomirabilis sp.]|nr:PGF-pre-PGF domain-containing protein [Candidatus Methylomirabilis sp.]